uniref:Uncharacterized protein n=1 Tax=Tetranychus urticae TaxID=32264 RepID=T1KKD1_TETUR
MNIFDADFIHFDKLESCHFYNECKSRATMKCSCINKAICGQHLINIHADVPGKKCEPETLHGNYMGIMCCKCNKLFARYVNRNNQQEICVSCFHDADSNDFVPKDLLTYENFKSKLKLINNALDKNIEMNKTRVVEFENSMKQKKKITDEALNRLLKLNNQCNHENMEKHIQMKSLNSEAVVAANKIKNLNMNDILIQAARNKQIDINVTLDKWQTWMKDRVRKLENPSVSCISIEFREDQGTSVAHKIIVRQEQHLGTCNFESCDPDNNMIIAGDDKTQDAISNGPCETEQELPRKRLKVRKGKVCRRRVIRNGGNKYD